MTVWSVCPLGYAHELDLLEIRFAEQASVVDRFVIVESRTHYDGSPKPLHFTSGDPRWAPWALKIHRAIVTDEPPPEFEPFQRFGVREHWQRENWQRKALTHALAIHGLEPDDVVCISDLDEILRASTIMEYVAGNMQTIVHPEIPMHRHYLNLHWRDRMALSIARLCRGVAIMEDPLGVEGVRRRDPQANWHVPYWNSYGDPEFDMGRYGWHFSWMGGTRAIEDKLRLAAHPEELHIRNSTRTAIRELVTKGGDLQGEPRPLFWIPDSRLPTHALDDRFAHLRCGPELATPGGEAGLAANPTYYWRG